MAGGASTSKSKSKKRKWEGRTVTYVNPDEVIPVAHIKNPKDHPFLDFALFSDERILRDKLITTEIMAHRLFNWPVLRDMPHGDRVSELIHGKWKDILDCRKPQYEELVLEFHCTFRHTEGDFLEEDAISFCLGRKLHKLTIPKFAVVTGFYTETEVATPDFLSSLRGAYKDTVANDLKEEDLKEFWERIAVSKYSKSLVSSDIKDPVLRYIHKILASSIVGRKSGEDKVNTQDLFCLLCIVDRHPVNFASLLVWSCTRPKRGGFRAGLYMGPYITQMAARLGVFQKYNYELMTKGPEPYLYIEKDLIKAGIWTVEKPHVFVPPLEASQLVPPEGTEASEVMHSSIPTHRQLRPRHRRELPPEVYVRREPAPEPLTLDSLYDAMDSRLADMRDSHMRDHRRVIRLIEEESRKREDDRRHFDELFRGMYAHFDIPIPPSLQVSRTGPSSSSAPASAAAVQDPPPPPVQD